MAKVIRRMREEDIDRNVTFVNTPATYEEAEKITGHKLDHRRNYAIIDNEICDLNKWVQPCSGCSCDGEYPCTCCTERSGGCEDCGFTGKRRIEMWFPIDTP